MAEYLEVSSNLIFKTSNFKSGPKLASNDSEDNDITKKTEKISFNKQIKGVHDKKNPKKLSIEVLKYNIKL